MEIEMIREIPMIDTHIHRVHPNRSPEFGNLGGGYIDGPDQPYHSRQTLLYGMVIEELKRAFDMDEQASFEEVERERFRRYSANPQYYYKSLLETENVAMYCLDTGSPLGGPSYLSNEILYFDGSIPIEKQRNIIRIDRLYDEIFDKELPFKTFLLEFQNALRKQVQVSNAIGLKSCSAYYGGLDVEIISQDQAGACYERIRSGSGSALDSKQLRNFILLDSADVALEENIPIQIHTGTGGGNYIDFRTMNPVNLIDFLKHPKIMNKVKIVLLHGGHPHEEETSFITAQFSNVYTDFSGTFYLCSVKGPERMCALIERAPLSKIMYGSDGVMFPEVSWFAHRHFRRQLTKVLKYLVTESCLNRNRAEHVAKMILHNNAINCYEKLKQNLVAI